jgi:hypothetical protein
MTNRAAHFKQSSVKRAIAAVLAAGLQVERVDIAADGGISVITGSPNSQPPAMTELKQWEAKRRARPI